MRTYDISLTIKNGFPVWPGDPQIILERIQKMEEGAAANVSHIQMGVHAGTHIDAPYHFMGQGASTVENLPLNVLIGRAYVLHVPDQVDLITAPYLEQAGIPPRTRRILFKTRNSRLWQREQLQFQTDFVAVSAGGAQYIVERGIKLVGVDYLSVAPFEYSTATHEVLLSAGVVILEGINLSEVSQGRYSLYCLPIKLSGADGAPARAILVGV